MLNWLLRKLRIPRPVDVDDVPKDRVQVQRPYVNVVYYPNWKIYNDQAPSSLMVNCVTHIFYAFLWPAEDGSVVPSDDYADTQIEVDGVKGCISALVQLKSRHRHLKTLVSIGGGGKGSSCFAHVARSDSLRKAFAQNVRRFVDLHGFNGADLDWEHPQDPREGANYVNLLAELRAALPSPDYILSSALPAGEWALRNINLRASAAHLDFFNVMAYDFSGPWVSQVGHHAQLYAPKRPHNDAACISGDSAVRYFLSQGVPSHQIILGVPAYGRSFLEATRVGDSYRGHAGDEGTFEYRDLPRPGAIESIDREVAAAYCIGGDGGFISYDTADTVSTKAHYVRNKQLGGLFYWTGTGDVDGTRSLVKAGFDVLH